VLVQPGPKVVTLSRAAADKVESDAKAPALLAAVGYLAGSDWLLIRARRYSTRHFPTTPTRCLEKVGPRTLKGRFESR
jgi:hypothetical protein